MKMLCKNEANTTDRAKKIILSSIAQYARVSLLEEEQKTKRISEIQAVEI
jgi:hypothetical protein